MFSVSFLPLSPVIALTGALGKPVATMTMWSTFQVPACSDACGEIQWVPRVILTGGWLTRLPPPGPVPDTGAL